MPLPLLLVLGVGVAAVGAAVAAQENREQEQRLRRQQQESEDAARRERQDLAKKNATLQIQSFADKHSLPQSAAQSLLELASQGSLGYQTFDEISEAHAVSNPKILDEDRRLKSIDARMAELNRAAQILGAISQNGASRG